MLVRQSSADREVTSSRVQQCDSRIPWRQMRQAGRRFFSLNLSPWPRSSHCLGRLDRRRGCYAQVVGGGPEPDRAWVCGIWNDRNQDIGLPGGIHVVGRFVGVANQRDVLAHERVRNLPNSYSAGEVEIERKSMTMENGRLHH